MKYFPWFLVKRVRKIELTQKIKVKEMQMETDWTGAKDQGERDANRDRLRLCTYVMESS